jgi:hypothetical protein
MRRVVYVIVGIVTINVALMVAMYVHLREDETCDTHTRGLVIWSNEQEGWLQVDSPEQPSDLPPCRGMFSSELTILPG